MEVLELLLSKHFNAKCKKVPKQPKTSNQGEKLSSETFEVNVNWVEKGEEKPSKEVELPGKQSTCFYNVNNVMNPPPPPHHLSITLQKHIILKYLTFVNTSLSVSLTPYNHIKMC